MPYSLVSIILPVHNQAEHIESVVSAYIEKMELEVPLPFEIIIVANACTDRSAQVCEELSQRFKQIKVIETEFGGWGHSVKLGLQRASGDLLCYTNSARTSAETLVRGMKLAIANPNTIIKANRKIRESWQRRLGSLLYNLECRAFFDVPIWDINGTPKIFPKAFDKLLTLQRDDDLIDAEFTAICAQAPYPVLEMPVLAFKRHGGKSTTNYNSALKMYWGAFQLWRQMPTRAQQ